MEIRLGHGRAQHAKQAGGDLARQERRESRWSSVTQHIFSVLHFRDPAYFSCCTSVTQHIFRAALPWPSILSRTALPCPSIAGGGCAARLLP